MARWNHGYAALAGIGNRGWRGSKGWKGVAERATMRGNLVRSPTNKSDLLRTTIPARDEHVRVAIHHPPQPVPVGISQATPRSPRHRRQLPRQPEIASRAVQPGG